MKNTFINDKVPSEILFKIFQHLSQRDLLQVQKVCNLWYLSAQPFYWEYIQLKNKNQLELFLQHCSDITNKPIKKIVIGCRSYLFQQIEYTLEKQQVEQLLFNLPFIMEIIIETPFAMNFTELNNPEFLKKLRDKCPDIKSFFVEEGILFKFKQYKDYFDILYSLRQTLTKINIYTWETPTIKRKRYIKENPLKSINLFSQLEELTVTDLSLEIKEVLSICEVLPRLKGLNVSIAGYDYIYHLFNEEYTDEIKIEQNQIIKRRVESLEKLKLNGFDLSPLNIKFIKKYFIGLKEIVLHHNWLKNVMSQEDELEYDNFLKFVCSRDRFIVKTNTSHFNQVQNFNTITISLQNTFNHIPNNNNNNNVLKHLEIILDGNDYEREDTDIDYQWFKIFTESKKSEDNQQLRIAKLYISNSEAYVDSIYEILCSTLLTLTNLDSISLKIDGLSDYFPFKSFKLIGKILSIIPAETKNVMYCIPWELEWNEYFEKYKIVDTYNQVTHLKILGDYDFEVEEVFDIPKFVTIFSGIKYLTIQDHSGLWNSEKNEFSINLPNINLNKLLLDVTTIKQQAKELEKSQNTISMEFFLLEIIINETIHRYKVSLSCLDATILTDYYEDNENTLNSNYILMQIILNDIQCLELSLYEEYNFRSIYYDSDMHGIEKAPEKLLERRIYFY